MQPKLLGENIKIQGKYETKGKNESYFESIIIIGELFKTSLLMSTFNMFLKKICRIKTQFI